MSEEKDSYTFEDSEEEIPSDDFPAESNENKIEPLYEEPIDSSIAPIDPEEEARKKKRRRILIIIFAITLPIVLGVVGLGFLIWGLVVGFTTCTDSCCNAFNECFSCCNCCTNCVDSCSSCGSSCDNCCGSSSTIVQSTNKSANCKSSISIKENLQFTSALLKWYLYRLVEFIEQLFSI